MADVQGQLFSMAEAQPARQAWARPCGYGWPYAIPRPTATQPNRLELVTCTRPEGPGGPWHMYSDLERGVVCTWDRGGRPVWPPVLR